MIARGQSLTDTQRLKRAGGAGIIGNGNSRQTSGGEIETSDQSPVKGLE